MSTRRVQNSIDYIEENLTSPLSASSIASKANWSEWHFRRIFHSTIGLSLKSYIRKRRLHDAASKISSCSQELLDIAIEFGFESQETFTRAFKKEFSITPGEFRKSNLSKKPFFKPIQITNQYLEQIHGDMVILPKYVDLKAMKLVGKTTRFVSILSKDANNFSQIGSCWNYFFREKEQLRPINKQEWGVVDILIDIEKHPDEFWYLAGCENTGDEVPENFELKYIPAGRYVVFTHKGKLNTIKETYNYIFGHWIHKTKDEYREAPELELYDERFSEDSESSEMDIYVPVR